MADFRNEFPDFPADAYPALPEGFVDSSWHNDAMPSATSAAKRLHIWIDDPSNSYWQDVAGEAGKRFTIMETVDEDGTLAEDEPLFETDDWTEALAFIAKQEG